MLGNDVENSMTASDYSPMINSDQPVGTCDWCGGEIYPGEKYLDIGDKLCSECLDKHTKEA